MLHIMYKLGLLKRSMSTPNTEPTLWPFWGAGIFNSNHMTRTGSQVFGVRETKISNNNRGMITKDSGSCMSAGNPHFG